LPPGTGHPGDVGAPEHSLGTERVKATVQVLVEAASYNVSHSTISRLTVEGIATR
jgi:hypothetical protein